MEVSNERVYDQVKLGDCDFQILEITEKSGELEIPNVSGPLEDGQEFLIIKTSLKNNSNDPYSMTSFLTMDMKDEEGNHLRQVMLLDEDRTINADILPGEERVGEVAFIVPESGKLIFSFIPSLLDDEAMTAMIRE